MYELFVGSWWILALRGAIAIMFGVLALLSPGLTLLSLIALFAAYALLCGAVSLFGAVRNRRNAEEWWLPLLLGLFSIGAGTLTYLHPALSALILVLLIGANAMVTGVLDVIAAIRLRKTIKDEWLLILSGAMSIMFGALVFLFPGAGALALVWLISLYAFVTGVLQLGLAFRLRARAKSPIKGQDRRSMPDRRISAVHS
jgi:uncharacterized membrane protein HdeD (DUF308 family)